VSDQPPQFAPLQDLPAYPLWEQYVGLWAIEGTRMAALWSQLRGMDLRAHMAAATVKSSASVRRQQNFALIEIRGTMTKHGSSMSDAGSTVRIRQAIRQLAADESVDGIMLVVDSGGGVADGTQELHDDVAAAAKRKPVLAFVEDVACSACYFAIASATKIVANTPHAWVGSIGTLFAMYDFSIQAENDGVRPVLIGTGEMKGAGFKGAPISAAQEAMFRELVESTQKSFSAAVKSGRKLTASQMKEVETARVFSATAAQELNLIDGVMSFDAAVKELGRMAKERGKPKMSDVSQSVAIVGESLKIPVATAAQIKAACPGCDADFTLAQLMAGATEQAAVAAWCQIQTLKIEAISAKLAAAEATIAEQAKQLEFAAKSRGQHAPLKEKPGQSTAGAGSTAGGAQAQADQLIQQAMTGGLSRQKAHAKVMRENPDLRQAIVAEANS
jgi:signal peptide peptidase SppA